MNTWLLVIFKYALSGLSTTFSIAERTVAGKVLPAVKWEWLIKFDSGEAMALLTLVFGLYFGGKFSPDAKNGEVRDLQGESK